MRSRLRVAMGAIAVVGLIACSTLKIKVGWDQNVDFSKYYTWAWKDDGSIRDPVWKKRFQDVLADVLAAHKLAPIDTNADLWVVVHARLSSETEVVPYSPAWGYAWGPWATAYFPTEYQIPVGTILIDMVDARQKQLVWRGKAQDAIRAGRTNEQREQTLTQVLTQLFAGYPPAAPASKAAGAPAASP
jgi:Domain of unknown function (DUF4136)